MSERSAVSVLVVDDDPAVRESLSQWLQLANFDVATFEHATSALSQIDHRFRGVLVCDVKMPDMDGMDVLRFALAQDPDLPVILITGHGDISMAVDAMQCGAYDFVEKPFDPERLVDAITRACEKRRLTLENRRLQAQYESRGIEGLILGTSPAVQRLRDSILELAGTSVNVIVYGETGSGKELVARCLHDVSPRREARLVALNCAAIPETMFESELFGYELGAFTGATKRRLGRLEHAHRGTLFLDEVEAMPLHLQAKLLRVLEDRSVERLGSNSASPADVRSVAASKVDLQTASKEGRFRADLYYRLGVSELKIPPLRERGDDVLLLFEHFASNAARAHERIVRPLDGATERALAAHMWPGNVRELRNAAERYALGICTLPVMQSVPVAIEAQSLADQVESFERRLIEQALEKSGGSIAATMALLQLPRRTLNEKMSRYGIERARYLDV
ncbi:sigma-54 dependent transcriptional regulator [Pseudorhodoferax sp. Leaf265]|uniref:sigma-54-dependent transcriptional regulator n=1 Tax=Pseudorhodoferax sp. Leaf265 TaxID=1736315 RepID=UPI0006F667F6|nr:sigma-54 dependent transcriptional regulator [Pseudorhodoferax sp. Leaf265]KQP19259.1 C4-dicarboxylate ABC transporter [Pseudorhodoferax sp. Leaf265]